MPLPKKYADARSVDRSHLLREFILTPLVLLVFLAMLFPFCSWADTVPKPPDFCYREDYDRHKRALASLTDKEIKRYIQKAEAGDAQAMIILAKVRKMTPDGTPDAAFTSSWLQRAVDAGDKMLELRERRNAAITAGKWDEYEKATVDETMRALEADALSGSEASAMTMAQAYRTPGAYQWVSQKPDIERSLHWYRFAASLGSRRAPVTLCHMYFMGFKEFGLEGEPNYQEAAHWCVRAAHVSCSAGPALHLSTMFEKGLGVPRNLEQSMYWDLVGGDRLDRDRLESITRRARELKYR